MGNMEKRSMVLAAGATVALTIVAGFAMLYAFTWWVMRDQKIKLFNEESGKSLLQLVDQGKTVGRMVIGTCATREDLSSIGNRDNEQRMEVLSQLLTFSEAQTGTPAKGTKDLNSLTRLAQPRAAYVDQLSKECSVFPMAENATLLNCDGLVLTPKVIQNTSAFAPNLRRFYFIDGHEVMYRPIVKCN
jgi:hypothetical protein